MSLTTDQITAKNFKKFYEEIRPYLNGTPPTYANMFNRSDLYSTDEKIVGCWIDGKPLYQKTYSDIKNTASSGEILVDASMTRANYNLVDGILIKRVGTSSDNWDQPVPYNDNSSNGIYGITTTGLKISLHGFSIGNSFDLTIKYTKTTDTTIKVGTGNDYSTEEQIVGTWIDGKDLWQKTVELGALPNNSSKSVAHGISNLNEIVEIKGICKSGTSFMQLGKPSIGSTQWAIDLEVVGNNVAVTTGSDRTSWMGVCTLRYTKTV